MLHVLTHSFPTRLSSDPQHGQKCVPRDVHHAPHEQQRHQQPTAAHAIGAVKNAHAQRAGPAWPIVAAQELGGMAALAKACVLRSEEHTSELQSLMRISYAVFCLKKKKKILITHTKTPDHRLCN